MILTVAALLALAGALLVWWEARLLLRRVRAENAASRSYIASIRALNASMLRYAAELDRLEHAALGVHEAREASVRLGLREIGDEIRATSPHHQPHHSGHETVQEGAAPRNPEVPS